MYQIAHFLLLGLCFSFSLHAKPGDLIESFPKSVNFFTQDTHTGVIYASTKNDILIINPETLKFDTIQSMKTIHGLALSEDGLKLYAASASQEILIIDTKTREILDVIALPYSPFDVVYAKTGYLYATLNDYNRFGVMQIDLHTNQFAQLYGDTSPYVYGKNFIQISPDSTMLYLGDADTPPGTLGKYHISSGNQFELIYKNPYNTLGGGGWDLHLSRDGQAIYYLTTGGNSWYDVARIDTRDMSISGYLKTSAQPTSLTTSPDGKIAYIYANNYIEVWDTENYKKRCQHPVNHDRIDIIGKMITDNTGKLLFCASKNALEVYETGCE